MLIWTWREPSQILLDLVVSKTLVRFVWFEQGLLFTRRSRLFGLQQVKIVKGFEFTHVFSYTRISQLIPEDPGLRFFLGIWWDCSRHPIKSTYRERHFLGPRVTFMFFFAVGILRGSFLSCVLPGVMKLPILGGIKLCKCMVILGDFPCLDG